eukprot:3826129-Amphidinium_carterae.1
MAPNSKSATGVLTAAGYAQLHTEVVHPALRSKAVTNEIARKVKEVFLTIRRLETKRCEEIDQIDRRC